MISTRARTRWRRARSACAIAAAALAAAGHLAAGAREPQPAAGPTRLVTTAASPSRAAASPAAPERDSSGKHAASVHAEPADSQPAAAELREVVGRVRPRVERIRGLSFRREVAVHVVDAAGARERLRRRLRQFQDDADLRREQRALQLLGVLPDDIDVLEEYLGYLGRQAGGFYDPGSGAFYLLEHVPRSLTAALAAHELTHALEDQHFDLDARLRGAGEDDDRMFALSAIHEGSATLLMGSYVLAAAADGSLSTADLQALSQSEMLGGGGADALHPALLRPLLGAYVLGTSFLLGGDLTRMATEGYPAARVDRSYRDGPRSSEQLIHPGKFWDPDLRDDPLAVELGNCGKALGRRWSKRADGVLGELMLGTLVGAPTPRGVPEILATSAESWTNAAASGWGGDRWELWTRGRHAVALLSTVWDSDADAGEFAGALERRRGRAHRRTGRRVAVIAGDAGPRLDALFGCMLGGEGP